MDGIEKKKLGGVTGRRFILRLLFFVLEAATIALWFIFTGGTGLDVYYRGILLEPFRTLEPIGYVVFLSLAIVSFFLRRTDGRLAVIGFGTFFGILILIAGFQLF